MIYVSVTYTHTDFDAPECWLKRIQIYTGTLECLAKTNKVYQINLINYEGELLYHGVQNYFVKLGKGKNYFPWKLNRLVKKLNPDVVIVQGLHQPLQLIQLGLTLKKDTRIIAHHHAEKPLQGIKRYIQEMAGRFVDAYLFASFDLSRDWINKGNISSPQKVHEVMEVSSNFYPVEKQQAIRQTGVQGDQVFLWVGRLNDNKDPLTVVRAFLKYAKVVPGARMYMIYHTRDLLDEINRLLQNASDKNAITLIGQVEHEKLLYWFNSADFFISGSHYEGAGTALCEAISCGCIPIVTDIPSFRMMTDKGNCGILYEAGNESALLAALIQSGQINMSEKQRLCLKYFDEKLSFSAIAGQIQQIAENL